MLVWQAMCGNLCAANGLKGRVAHRVPSHLSLAGLGSGGATLCTGCNS
jgi:hypothetical protein